MEQSRYEPMRRGGSRVPPLSTQKIRQHANLWRNLLAKVGSKPNGRVEVVDTLEFHLPKLIPNFTYECVQSDTSLLNGAEAITYPDQNRIVLAEHVYKGAAQGVGKDRFTIAHEIGHLFLHRRLSAYPRNISNHVQTHRKYEDSEWQADTFAAEFLMPYEEVKANCSSARDVQVRFDVSTKAAEYRFRNTRK
ncbi:ImmA/IrrE family metallo-endopeptidase [Microbulbifer sp. SSSA008]|uniref:ImmA/IrrE family metallo-endopeptidase n=1 Tax=unclassified Microbulbifer TaxID=2619833 RepID=UPI004039A762